MAKKTTSKKRGNESCAPLERNNPCPICNRTKDDKCAWNSSVIHCYDGVTNYPPRNLKLGGIVQINYGSTRDWALVKKDAGFSGNHWIFIPNKPLDKSKPLIKNQLDRSFYYHLVLPAFKEETLIIRR